MNKRGLSSVVIVVLLVLLTIAAAVILWSFVKSSIFTSSEDVEAGLLSSRVEIVSRSVKVAESTLEFSVQRKAGDGNVVGVYYVVESTEGDKITGEEKKDLGELQATNLINVDFSGYDEFEVSKIVAYPLIRNSKGQEKIGKVSDEFKFEKSPIISSGNSGGGQSGGSINVEYYCDIDSDGYLDSSISGSCTGSGCEPSGCSTSLGNDCLDSNSAVNPGATEICGNGFDDDCNNQQDESGCIACLDRFVTLGLQPNEDVGPNEWDFGPGCSGNHFQCLQGYDGSTDTNAGSLVTTTHPSLERLGFEDFNSVDNVVEITSVTVSVSGANYDSSSLDVEIYLDGYLELSQTVGIDGSYRVYDFDLPGPWTKEQIDSLEIVVKSHSSGISYGSYLFFVYAEVNYERSGNNLCEL